VNPRFFTVEEARALLPRLEDAFERIVELRREIERRTDQLQILDTLWGRKIREAENPDHEEFLTHEAWIRGAFREVERMVEEQILGLGVRFPQGGLEHGLVDFPTRLDGRTVYLCWRLGEPDIVAWHEVDAGFQGRRPLTPGEALRMRRDDPAR
jgi:hypothetical protein